MVKLINKLWSEGEKEQLQNNLEVLLIDEMIKVIYLVQAEAMVMMITKDVVFPEESILTI
jgi:hypothetical protein